MKQLFCIFLSLLLLCGCGMREETPAETVTPNAETTEYKAPVDVRPEFAAVTDLSASVISVKDQFDESMEKQTLVLQDNDLGEYVFSEFQLHITPEMELTYSCSWARTGCKLYFGLLNSDNEVFVVSQEGGSMVGTLSMANVPEDDYQLILYSNNNTEVQAVLHYQFL